MSRPPPEPEEEGGRAIRPGTTRKKHSNGHLLDKSGFGNRDRWIRLYLEFLEREIQRLNSGPIGRHYLRCAAAAHDDFVATKCPRARYRAWLGIRTCCQWICQLGGEGVRP